MEKEKIYADALSANMKLMSGIILEHDAEIHEPSDFSGDDLLNASIIFQNVFINLIWKLQESEDIPYNIRADMAEKAGTELWDYIKRYTNINLHEVAAKK